MQKREDLVKNPVKMARIKAQLEEEIRVGGWVGGERRARMGQVLGDWRWEASGKGGREGGREVAKLNWRGNGGRIG